MPFFREMLRSNMLPRSGQLRFVYTHNAASAKRAYTESYEYASRFRPSRAVFARREEFAYTGRMSLYACSKTPAMRGNKRSRHQLRTRSPRETTC